MILKLVFIIFVAYAVGDEIADERQGFSSESDFDTDDPEVSADEYRAVYKLANQFSQSEKWSEGTSVLVEERVDSEAPVAKDRIRYCKEYICPGDKEHVGHKPSSGKCQTVADKPTDSECESKPIREQDDPSVLVGSHRGIPGVDYPDYTEIPNTSFTCSDKEYIPGFYADQDTDCQVFHVCYENRMESFLCPPGTIFSQPLLACDFWYSASCSDAPSSYQVNEPKPDKHRLIDTSNEELEEIVLIVKEQLEEEIAEEEAKKVDGRQTFESLKSTQETEADLTLKKEVERIIVMVRGQQREREIVDQRLQQILAALSKPTSERITVIGIPQPPTKVEVEVRDNEVTEVLALMREQARRQESLEEKVKTITSLISKGALAKKPVAGKALGVKGLAAGFDKKLFAKKLSFKLAALAKFLPIKYKVMALAKVPLKAKAAGLAMSMKKAKAVKAGVKTAKAVDAKLAAKALGKFVAKTAAKKKLIKKAKAIDVALLLKAALLKAAAAPAVSALMKKKLVLAYIKLLKAKKLFLVG